MQKAYSLIITHEFELRFHVVTAESETVAENQPDIQQLVIM